MSKYLSLQSSLDSSVRREHKFDIQYLVGEEGNCKNFSYRLKISTLERLTNKEIDKLIGGSLTVKIGYKDQKGKSCYRLINGIVYQLNELGMSRDPLTPEIWRYELEISSWMKKLEYVKECRIFQKNGNTGMSIISGFLRELGFHDFKNEAGADFPRRDYETMYNESVSNFIRRLLQKDGVIWRFEHFENKHVLIFSKDSTTLPEIADNSSGQLDAVKSFCEHNRHLPVKECMLASYKWQSPPVKNVVKQVYAKKGSLTHYSFSGRFSTRGDGETKVRQRNLALKCQTKTFSGESTMRAFIAGKRFTLLAPILPELSGKSFLLRDLKIEATDDYYSNSFEAIPAKQRFLTLEEASVDKPILPGTQTAIVVGEAGKANVQTDTLGRVKVRFHWDHHSPNESSHTSAYIRVSMPSAGNKRGFLFNPRVGEEVVVDFEDGDLNKPVIIGSLYFKSNPPPFAPNEQPFKSIIKNSASSDANQVLFDDKPGAENLEIIVKKEMTIDVNHNMTMDVKKDANITCASEYIVVKTGVDIKAGNEINNLSLATFINIAAKSITNSACGNILNMAAGIVSQAAGGILSNLAGVMVANTSILGITQSAAGPVSNDSKVLMLNTASEVINAGEQAVSNKADLAILNNAATDMVNKGNNKKSKTLMSMTEAETFVITGDTTVGP